MKVRSLVVLLRHIRWTIYFCWLEWTHEWVSVVGPRGVHLDWVDSWSLGISEAARRKRRDNGQRKHLGTPSPPALYPREALVSVLALPSLLKMPLAAGGPAVFLRSGLAYSEPLTLAVRSLAQAFPLHSPHSHFCLIYSYSFLILQGKCHCLRETSADHTALLVLPCLLWLHLYSPLYTQHNCFGITSYE